MSAIRARVQNGRLQVDEPTGLPEGTVLDLVVDDKGDDLDEAERAALNELIVAPEAEAQIREIDAWWRENRKAAPDLFAQELADATTTLETMPLPMSKRRILLRTTRYHVYYVTDAETVLVLAVWSAVRGSGPDLKRLLH